MTTENNPLSPSVSVRSSEGTYEYLDRRPKEVEAKSVSFINNPVAGRVTLIYYIHGLEGPEKVEREFSGHPGGALRECNAKGEWKQVCEGLGSEGYTVSIGANETLKSVVQREFKTFKRRDKTSGNPHLVTNMGRPKTVDGKNVNAYLDSASLAMAQVVGAGNTSEGIRQALALPPALVALLDEQKKAYEHMQAMQALLWQPPSPAFVEAMERVHQQAKDMEKILAPLREQLQVTTANEFNQRLIEQSRKMDFSTTQPHSPPQPQVGRARRGRPTLQEDLDRLSNPSKR